MLCTRLRSDAGPAGKVRCGQVYNVESPKQDSKQFNFITKTTHFASLVILFIYNFAPLRDGYIFQIRQVRGGMISRLTACHEHKRRIKTEGKAKVVACVWGEEFIQFIAAQAVLH